MYIQKRHKILVTLWTILPFFWSADHIYAMKHLADDQETDERASKRAAPSSPAQAAPKNSNDTDDDSAVSESIVPSKMREDDDPEGLTDALSSVEDDEDTSYSDSSNLDDRYDNDASSSSDESVHEKTSIADFSESDGSDADDEEIFSPAERKRPSSHRDSNPKTDEDKSS